MPLNSSSKTIWDIENLKSQINFRELFANSPRIVNASYLFAVFDLDAKDKGLKIIDSSLLSASINITNISGMFYYNTSMKGSVPEFNSSVHTVLNTVSGYLTSVSEGNITNSSKLEQRLIPQGWSNYIG